MYTLHVLDVCVCMIIIIWGIIPTSPHPPRRPTYYYYYYIQFAFYDQSIIHATKPLFIYGLILQIYKTFRSPVLWWPFFMASNALHTTTTTTDWRWWWLILRCQMAFLMSKLKFPKEHTQHHQHPCSFMPASLNLLNFQTTLNSNSMRREKWHFHNKFFNAKWSHSV